MIGGFRAETDKRGSEGYWEQPRGPVARQREEPDASSYPGAVSVAFREKKNEGLVLTAYLLPAHHSQR